MFCSKNMTIYYLNYNLHLKNERINLLNLSYNISKVNKTVLIGKLAQSIDCAQSFKSSMILLNNFNLNYHNAEYEKNFRL